MIRGLWTHAGTLYSVESGHLYSIQKNGTTTQLAEINSTSGSIDFESNLTQLCFTDGSYLYVYDPIAGTLVEAANYPGGKRLSFLNQRINFLYPFSQKYGWTALGDARTIAALDFKSAESNPDKLVSQVAFNSELILFGETSTEIHDPVTTTDIYVKSSAAIDYGCIAAFTAQKTAKSVYWLARDVTGQATVQSLRGHQAVRVSTRSEEEKFEGLELSNASAFTISQGGQAVYCLNVPGLDTTLCWDETHSMWHERAEWDGAWSKWRPTCHAFAYGNHYYGAGETLYRSDRLVNKYGDDVKRRQRIAPVISTPEQDKVFAARFELVCDKGTGAAVMMRRSDDNGANWKNWRTASVGATGNYKGRARWNRCGASRNSVFDIVMTDDAPFNPIAASVQL